MIRISDLHMNYTFKGVVTKALNGMTLDINKNDYTALVGPAGSGKSTLLACITGLLHPESGEIYLEQYKIHKISRRASSKIRAKYFGIIFQFSELIPRFTIDENLRIAWNAIHGDKDWDSYKVRLEYLSEILQMKDIIYTYPYRLSGGQLQKAAIARGLIKDPPIILADEPSGDLDPENAEKVKTLFQKEQEAGKTILLVTHDMKFAMNAKTVFEIRDGKVFKLIKG